MEAKNCPFCGRKPKVYGYIEYDRNYEPSEEKITKVKCPFCKITLSLEIWNGPSDKEKLMAVLKDIGAEYSLHDENDIYISTNSGPCSDSIVFEFNNENKFTGKII